MTEWAFGALMRGQIAELCRRGYWTDFLDWAIPYEPGVFTRVLEGYDYLVTCTGALAALKNQGVPFNRIMASAHGVLDLDHALRHVGNEGLDSLAGFSVVSAGLVESSAALGIRRVPVVTPVGHTPAVFEMPLPDRLRVAGYASSYYRVDEGTDVDIKRGALARAACELAGVEFRRAVGYPYQAMPVFYKGVDCVLMSSISEGGPPLPMVEGAMSGRLCLGTPVGTFAEDAKLGTGVLVPVDPDTYVDRVATLLCYYRAHPGVFRDKCAEGREAAVREHAWERRIESWIGFLTGNARCA